MRFLVFRLNAPGDFYVADDLCIACTAPEHEAPDLMAHDTSACGGYHCYFKKQPETPEEETRAVRAVAVGCCAAVRYGGNDKRILDQLVRMGAADACDEHSTSGTTED